MTGNARKDHQPMQSVEECRHARRLSRAALGLTNAFFLANMVCTPLPVQANEMMQEPAKPSASSQMDSEMVLNELNHLAKVLEKERKFNRILLEKIDALTVRLNKLEAQPDDLSKELSEQSHLPKAESQTQAPARQPPQSMTKEPEGKAQSKSKGAQSPKAGKDHAQRNKPQDENWPEEFERFLDMGEAMLRRFFGVVKEFRQDFEDNRA